MLVQGSRWVDQVLRETTVAIGVLHLPVVAFTARATWTRGEKPRYNITSADQPQRLIWQAAVRSPSFDAHWPVTGVDFNILLADGSRQGLVPHPSRNYLLREACSSGQLSRGTTRSSASRSNSRATAAFGQPALFQARQGGCHSPDSASAFSRLTLPIPPSKPTAGRLRARRIPTAGRLAQRMETKVRQQTSSAGCSSAERRRQPAYREPGSLRAVTASTGGYSHQGRGSPAPRAVARQHSCTPRRVPHHCPAGRTAHSTIIARHAVDVPSGRWARPPCPCLADPSRVSQILALSEVLTTFLADTFRPLARSPGK